MAGFFAVFKIHLLLQASVVCFLVAKDSFIPDLEQLVYPFNNDLTFK